MIKRITIKAIKKLSRERIPVSSLKGRVIPSKKRNLIEKALKKNQMEHGEQ
ncbi:MAG: hypothetical protein AB1552_13995 [Nitrospirota bacterium]